MSREHTLFLFLQLMHQIDVLLSSQTLTHQQQLDTLKQQVQSRDKELSSLRLAIREKSIQVGYHDYQWIMGVVSRVINFVKI